MKEDLLQYIWQQKLLLNQPLLSTSGKRIIVVKPGRLNHDSGPDFFDARIMIENTLWVGNIEVHVNSSDWLKHKHQDNPAYHNVVLHIVFNDDVPLNIPTLEIKKLLPPRLIDAYWTLQQSRLRIPCENIIKLPENIVLEQFMHRLMVARLEAKCALLETELLHYKNNWSMLFYVTIAKYFGMQVNAEPFQQLARLLPQQILAKHKHNRAQIDALVFGVAGFLPARNDDEYTFVLNREFEFLKNKYALKQLPVEIWKFGKTRPSNFPTIRLAQFSALVFQSTHLFSKLIESTDITQAESLLSAEPSKELNLDTFYPAKHVPLKGMGKSTLHHLLINAAVPIKFIFGKHMMNEQLCSQALDWLEKLPPEKNAYSRFWSTLGLTAQHALHSQAIIELNNNYCNKRDCLNCAIGNNILLQHA